MGGMCPDAEIELQDRFIVRPSGYRVGAVMGELKPYAREFARVVFEAGCFAVGRAREVLLNAALLKGLLKDVQKVVPSTDTPAVLSVDPLNIEPVLPAPQWIDDSCCQVR